MDNVTIKMENYRSAINISGTLSVDQSVDVIDMLVRDMFKNIQSDTTKNYVRQQLISGINQSFDYSILTNDSKPLVRL
jgi:hypothetical protein